jgi:hypothetical protein
MTISREQLTYSATAATTSTDMYALRGGVPSSRHDELVARFALAVSADASIWLYFAFMGTNYLKSLAESVVEIGQDMMEAAEGTLYEEQFGVGGGISGVQKATSTLQAQADNGLLTEQNFSRIKAEIGKHYRGTVKGSSVIGNRVQKRGATALAAYQESKEEFLAEYSTLLRAVDRVFYEKMSIRGVAGNTAANLALSSLSESAGGYDSEDPVGQLLALVAAVAAAETLSAPEDPWSLEGGQQLSALLHRFPLFPSVSAVGKALFFREAGSAPAVTSLCTYLANLCATISSVSSDSLSRMSITVPEVDSLASLCAEYTPSFTEDTKKAARSLMDSFSDAGFDLGEVAMRRGYPSFALREGVASSSAQMSANLPEVVQGLRR